MVRESRLRRPKSVPSTPGGKRTCNEGGTGTRREKKRYRPKGWFLRAAGVEVHTQTRFKRYWTRRVTTAPRTRHGVHRGKILLLALARSKHSITEPRETTRANAVLPSDGSSRKFPLPSEKKLCIESTCMLFFGWTTCLGFKIIKN